jgi:hypothetical protein
VPETIEKLSHARLGIHEVACVHADVERREVEAEQVDTPAQRGKRTVRDSRAAVRAQAAVEQREIFREVLCRGVRIAVEAAPHERELPTIRLVEVLLADLSCVVGQLALVARDRLEQLVLDLDDPRRDADRGGERAHLVAVARAQEDTCALERLSGSGGVRVRVPVGVAADPRAEAERRRRIGDMRAVVGKQALRRVDEALLEEPEAVANLVDDPRPLRAHFVRLPERGDLGGELAVDRVPPREQRIVELSEQRGNALMRSEHGPPGSLCRMRS